MNFARQGLLIGSKPLDDFLAARNHLWQGRVCQDCFNDSARGFRTSLLQSSRNHGGSNHAPSHGFTVKKLAITSFCLESVPDRMTEIQDTSQVAFTVIGGDNFRFHLYRGSNQPVDRLAITLQNAFTVIFHELEDLTPTNQATLHYL